jgi:hypothetical protein
MPTVSNAPAATGVVPAVHAESGSGTVTSIGVDDCWTPLVSSVIVVCATVSSAKVCTPCGVLGADSAIHNLARISLSPSFRTPSP